MKRLVPYLVLLTTGCSNALVADTFDFFKPGRFPSEHKGPVYGGVGNLQPSPPPPTIGPPIAPPPTIAPTAPPGLPPPIAPEGILPR